jgi:hypothetical protein
MQQDDNELDIKLQPFLKGEPDQHQVQRLKQKMPIWFNEMDESDSSYVYPSGLFNFGNYIWNSLLIKQVAFIVFAVGLFTIALVTQTEKSSNAIAMTIENLHRVADTLKAIKTRHSLRCIYSCKSNTGFYKQFESVWSYPNNEQIRILPTAHNRFKHLNDLGKNNDNGSSSISQQFSEAKKSTEIIATLLERNSSPEALRNTLIGFWDNFDQGNSESTLVNGIIFSTHDSSEIEIWIDRKNDLPVCLRYDCLNEIWEITFDWSE